MNADKLRRLQAQVRIGGKGTPRRKKKVMHQSAATDDKKLQSSLKKLSVSTIPGIEEVNIIKDDLTVIHFNNPKAQASLSANTFAVTGHGETKKIVEMLPEILPQLGQDTVMQLRMFANTMSGNQKQNNAASTSLGNVAEEDDVPLLVNDFEEVAKMEETKTYKSKDDGKKSEEVIKSSEYATLKENNEKKINNMKDATENIDRKSKKQQNKQSADGAAKIKSEVGKNENKQQKQTKQEKLNKQEKSQSASEKSAVAEKKQTVVKSEIKHQKEPEVKIEEGKHTTKPLEKPIEKQQQTAESTDLKAQSKIEEAMLEKKQKAANDELQKPAVEGQKPTEKPVEKKKEENLKDRKVQEDKKKDETSKSSKREQNKESKVPHAHATKKEEITKDKEVKDFQKAKKPTEKNKESDMQIKDQPKQQSTSKGLSVENNQTEKKNQVSVDQAQNTNTKERKILNTNQEQTQLSKEDGNTENKKLSTTNDLNNVAIGNTQNKEDIQKTNIVAEVSSRPISVKVSENIEPTEANLKIQEVQESVESIPITTKLETIGQPIVTAEHGEKAPITQEILKKPNRPLEIQNQQGTTSQLPEQLQQLITSEKTQEQKEIKSPESGQTNVSDSELKKQTLPKLTDDKKGPPTNQVPANNKKEDTKGKPLAQAGAQAKPAKPATAKPSSQTKPILPVKTSDKVSTAVKSGAPIKAASPQPKTSATPNKKIPSPTATPPTTPTEANIAISLPATDAKVSTSAGKKPETAPKPIQNKSSQQKTTNTNPTIDNKKQTVGKQKEASAAKTAINVSAQQEEKKQVNPPKSDNTKPQSVSTLNTSQQSLSKQLSPAKQLAPAKQPTPNKQASPAKQVAPTKAMIQEQQQQKTSTSKSTDQQSKPLITQSPQPATQQPKGTSKTAISQPKSNSTQPKNVTPQPTAPQSKVTTPDAGNRQPKVTSPQVQSPQPTASLPIAAAPQPIAQEPKENASRHANEPLKINTPKLAVDQQQPTSQIIAPTPTNQQSPPETSTLQQSVDPPKAITQKPAAQKESTLQQQQSNDGISPQPLAQQSERPILPVNQANSAEATVTSNKPTDQQ